jgi:hypothetical protein
MAQQPQHVAHNPANPPPGAPPAPAPAPAAPGYPGGMASDPAVALANEIVTSLRGAPDRMRSVIDNTPALKAVMDQAEQGLVADIALTIRRFVDGEVAKATGGMTLHGEKKPTI